MAFEPDATSAIKICERCYTPIESGEQYYRLAHIRRARLDGSIEWAHAHVHTDACTASGESVGDAAPGDRWGSRSGPV